MQDFTEKCVELELLHTVTSTPETQVKLSMSNFFSSLGSPRCKQMVEEISTDVRAQTDRSICHQKRDPLSVHAELDGFAIYASDVHSHKASAHEPPIKDKKQLRFCRLTHINLKCAAG